MNRLWQRIVNVDRAVWITAAGAALIALSSLPSWTAHPSASRSSVSAGELILVEQLFALDIFLRAAAWLGGIFFLVVLWRRVAPERWHLRVAWTLAAALFAFPCWLTQFYPERMAERKLLYEQMTRVADDMDANLTEQQADWRAWQRFSQGIIADMALDNMPPRTWDPAFFSPTQANRLIEDVLGLSPQFLGFVRAKLLVALSGGMALLLCGLHLARQDRPSDVVRGLRWGVASAALFVALPLGSRMVGEYHLVAGEQAARRGEPVAAMAHLSAARTWKPALGYSWWHYRRLGELTRLRDRPDSLAAMLADAHVELTRQRPEAALERLRQAQPLYPEEGSLKWFLALALTEAGIIAFNGGQSALAHDYWVESLSYVPINPLPWYGLSLVHTKRQRHDEAARGLDQLVRLQAYFGYKRLPVRGQTLVMKSWEALRRGDLVAAHEFYSQSLRPETW